LITNTLKLVYLCFNQCFKTQTGSRPGQGTGSLDQWLDQWIIGRTAWLLTQSL